MPEEAERPYATGLTLEQMRARVARGLITERNLLRLAWFILGLAILSLITTVALWITAQISMEQMLAAVFGVIMSSILSGAATYGSGVNVGLASSRLATSLPREEVAESGREA